MPTFDLIILESPDQFEKEVGARQLGWRHGYRQTRGNYIIIYKLIKILFTKTYIYIVNFPVLLEAIIY